MYNSIENYRIYLESKGVTIEEARPIKLEELESLGCSRSSYSCSSAPSWVCSTSYWSGSSDANGSVWGVGSDGSFGRSAYNYDFALGVRPVIIISKSLF